MSRRHYEDEDDDTIEECSVCNRTFSTSEHDEWGTLTCRGNDYCGTDGECWETHLEEGPFPGCKTPDWGCCGREDEDEPEPEGGGRKTNPNSRSGTKSGSLRRTTRMMKSPRFTVFDTYEEAKYFFDRMIGGPPSGELNLQPQTMEAKQNTTEPQ